MTTPRPSITRRTVAEFVGCAFLTAIVVGSGIAATDISDDGGIRLLINAIATAFGLFVLISVLGPISGAHLNPVVSIADLVSGQQGIRDAGIYVVAQVSGCIAGGILANIMFDRAPVQWSTTDRITPGHLLAEVVATAGLVFVILVLARTNRSNLVAGVVACFIGAAYFFTSSTSFANPAITIGRMFSDTFAGIAPGSAPLFIGAQLIGAAVGLAGAALLVGMPGASAPTTPPAAATLRA